MYDVPEELIVEADGPIRIITMNNPDMRNAFIDPLHEAMRNIWYQISRDRDARAVVLTGAGSAFCAGGNVPGFIRDYDDPEHRRQSLRDAQRLVDEMLRFHLPVVAAVNGPAVGLGASVAVSCDIVLIAESAYIADTHVNIGLTAGDGGAATWPLLIGMLRAKEYLLTGERIPAKLAVEIGLANRLVADDQLMQEATALAHKLAALPPQSLQETKRALNLHLQQAATTVLPFALSAEAESFATPEIKATIEKFSKIAESEVRQPDGAHQRVQAHRRGPEPGEDDGPAGAAHVGADQGTRPRGVPGQGLLRHQRRGDRRGGRRVPRLLLHLLPVEARPALLARHRHLRARSTAR